VPPAAGCANDLRRRLTATAVGCLALTFSVGLVPGLRFAYRAPALHVTIETAAALVAMLVAFLVAGRLRRTARTDEVLLLAALAVLALSDLLFAMVPASTGHATGRFPTWAATSDRLAASLLLAASAFAPSQTLRNPRRTATAVIGAAACLVALTAVSIALLGERLPTGVTPALTPEASGRPRLVGHPAVLAIQLAGAAVYALAAFGFARKYKRRGDALIGWLALAAVFAVFARVNYFLYPSLFTQWVYVGDAFRLAFYLLLLVGALREITGYFGIAAGAAVLEERRRIARDLHDTFAQELAFITRNVARLREPDAEEDLPERLAAAAGRALLDSRQVIATLAGPLYGPLEPLLAEVAREAAARYGVEVEVAVAERMQLDPARTEALLRIAAEAVANAARHGRADRVLVTLERHRGRPRLQVSDRGAGFDTAAVTQSESSGFGLTAMRERASSVGARVRIDSGAGGTTVDVTF
jgi:signal transduction histidine kinase